MSLSFDQTLQYLYQRLPAFHRVGSAALKPGLNNIRALCEALGNPQQQFKSIHVAGTNGKGSTSHLLAAVLQSAGYRVGLHTSPHLKSLTERFKINGELAPENRVVQFVAQHQTLIETLQPSFFEITVAMAFDFFAREKVDVAVIEVGLGGRLDSTNIITPQVSVITNISFDHTDLLGDTLPKIAAEKAGIIKPHIPVVISEFHPETAPVFEQQAMQTQSPLYFAEDFYEVAQTHLERGKSHLQILEKHNHTTEEYEIDLLGNYQQRNILGVLKTINVLKEIGYHISQQAIKKGLAHCTRLTAFKGRWQILQTHPLVIADIAHNPAGLAQNIAQLSTYDFRKLHLVLGFAKDKDIKSILALFPTQAHYYFCEFNLPRALPVTQLQEAAAQVGIQGDTFVNVNEALNAARRQATPEDIIYIGGSTFVVAEVEEV